MGRKSYTNFAIFNNERITSAKASKLVQSGIEVKDCKCIDCDKPMKFVPCKDKDNYFAHIVKKGEVITCKAAGREGELHELAKKLLSDVSNYDDCKYDGFYVNSDLKIYLVDIKGVYLEKKVTFEGKTIKPDVTLSTSKGTIYVEIINTHPLPISNKNVYRDISKNNDIHVVQIYIDDLSKLVSKEEHYYVLERMLKDRLFTCNDKKELLNMDSRFNPRKPFGVCYHCKSPYIIVANKEDKNTNTKVQESDVPLVSIVEFSRFKNSDRTSIGSALLHCPNCKEEGIYQPIYCPECLSKGKGYVPMKLLRNAKNGKVFLACSNYVSVEDSMNTGEISTCNCTLTVFNSNSTTYADELQSLSNFNKWLRGSYKEFQYVADVRNKGANSSFK